MPLVSSTYQPPFVFRNGFISTVYSGLARRVKGVLQSRERLTLNDGDFIDLDWSYSGNKTNKLIIVLHGLEGDAQRPYMLGTAKIFNNSGYDAICVNFRGCSGEENTKYRSYHSGSTEDLVDIINHIITTKKYSDIFIKGFSLGGNILLKYLGEGNIVPAQIKATMAVSVPCFLSGSAKALHTFKNVLYHDRFKKHLTNRLKRKQIHYPEIITMDEVQNIRTLYDFDNIYTAIAHGFKDAQDYYQKCSSLQFLDTITIPTLILNAKNDSFLSPECYPIDKAINNNNLFLETPSYGGHVGFVGIENIYYNEARCIEFFKAY